MAIQPQSAALCQALLLLVALLIAGIKATTDLSQSWSLGTLYNTNKAYCTIQSAMVPTTTRGYVVIQNGLLVAEGYTPGSAGDGQYDAWSATKSWSTFFMGVLVDQGSLTIMETLGDIFKNANDWDGVGEADNKRSIRVEELLTMTSGLVPGSCQAGVNEGQETLQAVLNHVDYQANQRGQFRYIGQNHILSRIIERRTGQTPREFASSSGIFAKLGISDSDFQWTTFGGVEESAYGLITNPRIMAKLGQLYLQGGLAATSDQLVSAVWVTASSTSYVDNNIVTGDNFDGYGYQWYASSNSGTGAYAGAAAAFGAEGQVIAYFPASDTTVAIMGDGYMGNSVSQTFLQTIVDNFGDLSVQVSSCSESFSYWNYFMHHSGQLLRDSLQIIPNRLRGRNLG